MFIKNIQAKKKVRIALFAFSALIANFSQFEAWSMDDKDIRHYQKKPGADERRKAADEVIKRRNPLAFEELVRQRQRREIERSLEKDSRKQDYPSTKKLKEKKEEEEREVGCCIDGDAGF